MRTLMTIAVLLAAPGIAGAQAPTVDPSGGGQPSEPAAPAQPVAVPVQPAQPRQPAQADQQQGEEQTEADVASRLGDYHLDDTDPYAEGPGDGPVAGRGPIPELHVVREGDTLWDICWAYFNDPWQWPRVWSYNPSITNPHWIYPGDLVRLMPEREAAATRPQESIEDTDVEVTPTPTPSYTVKAKQLAFVDKDEVEYAGEIVGSPAEKSLLATGDAVYIEYPEGRSPEVGETYTVYTRETRVQHPDTEQYVGSFVRILGDVQIRSAHEGKRARGVITQAYNVIERGHLVGPVQRAFQNVEPTPNERNLRGTIVAQLQSEQLIGQGEVVFIDLGTAHGLERGNRLYVIRRGDAYDHAEGPAADVGQDDPRFPARAIGEVVIVQTGKEISVGLVTLALQEMGSGDHVLMRK